jgi:hypothetical protein
MLRVFLAGSAALRLARALLAGPAEERRVQRALLGLALKIV